MMKIVGLFHYPVKSLPGIALNHSYVDELGLLGDRRWMIVDETGMFQTFRENPLMSQIFVRINDGGIVLSHKKFGSIAVAQEAHHSEPAHVRIWKDSVTASWVDKSADEFLSQIFERKLRLVYLDNSKAHKADQNFAKAEDYTSFADNFPILLTTTASLSELNSHFERPYEMRRFRPNIVIETEDPWVEDTWKLLRIGGQEFRVMKPCARCIMLTQDPDTGLPTVPHEPLQMLSKIHRSAKGKPIFGQNAIAVKHGELRIGDLVETLEVGNSI